MSLALDTARLDEYLARLFGEPVSADEFLEMVIQQATGEYPILRLPA